MKNEWMKVGCALVASVAVFSLSGCGQANAHSKESIRAAAVVAVADTQPTADADADNGPGCAEGALESARGK
jgi:hypothetical protein